MGVMASTPVAAEVCDKIRPAWNPKNGPVNQIEDLALYFVEPLGLIVLALSIAAVLLRKTWLTALVVFLLVATVALNISTWREADNVTTSAFIEGCITAPVLTTVILIAIATIISVITWHRLRIGRPEP